MTDDPRPLHDPQPARDERRRVARRARTGAILVAPVRAAAAHTFPADAVRATRLGAARTAAGLLWGIPIGGLLGYASSFDGHPTMWLPIGATLVLFVLNHGHGGWPVWLTAAPSAAAAVLATGGATSTAVTFGVILALLSIPHALGHRNRQDRYRRLAPLLERHERFDGVISDIWFAPEDRLAASPILTVTVPGRRDLSWVGHHDGNPRLYTTDECPTVVWVDLARPDVAVLCPILEHAVPAELLTKRSARGA